MPSGSDSYPIIAQSCRPQRWRLGNQVRTIVCSELRWCNSIPVKPKSGVAVRRLFIVTSLYRNWLCLLGNVACISDMCSCCFAGSVSWETAVRMQSFLTAHTLVSPPSMKLPMPCFLYVSLLSVSLKGPSWAGMEGVLCHFPTFENLLDSLWSE